ncbi:MAG: two-component regulator propeller domain-containing protein, partial [Acidimicrobiia bacterium]
MGWKVFEQHTGRGPQAAWWLVCFAGALAASFDRAAAAASMIDRTGRFAIQWWTADDGLPDSQLKGVAIAPDGSIVCATNRHLVQFDGVSFKPFPPQLTDSLHEAIGSFGGIIFDGDGRLWVQGSQKVARLDATQGRGGDEALNQRWRVFALADGRITGMMIGKDGRPVFVGPGLVLRFDGERVVPLAVRPPGGTAVPWMFGGIDPADGGLWLWGSAGKKRVLYRCDKPDGDRGTAVVVAQPEDVSAAVITMGFGPSGAFALLPDCVALHRDGRWERLPPTLPDAGYRISGKLVESTDNTLWISSHNGLLACRDGRIETAIEGLPGFSYFTHHLVADAGGGIWAACSGGLLAVRRTSLNVQPINECRAVFERSDGSLIVGTPGAVTLHVPLANGEHATAPRLLAALPQEAIPTAILETDDGRIWVGTQDNFLLRVADGAVTQVTKPAEHFRELRCIHALASDAHGRVWAATSNGLAVRDPATADFTTIGAHEGPLRP